MIQFIIAGALFVAGSAIFFDGMKKTKKPERIKDAHVNIGAIGNGEKRISEAARNNPEMPEPESASVQSDEGTGLHED